MSSVIINYINNIESYSYLELGIFDNKNFNQIKCNHKYSVDINGNALFTGTTDEYFSQLNSNIVFDIIYIDANHDLEYVVRDFNNSISHARRWILIHDMIPPTQEHTQSKFCSDSYKLLYYLMTETNNLVYPLDNDFGMTAIKIPASKVINTKIDTELSYSKFIKFITKQKIYTNKELIKLFNQENNIHRALFHDPFILGIK